MKINPLLAKVNDALGIEPPIDVTAYRTIADFTFLWSVYEGRTFSSRYGTSLMSNKVQSGIIRLQELDTYWEYFHSRYIGVDGQVNEYFHRLAFTSTPDKDRVQRIFTMPNQSIQDKTEAVLIVVHRFRNNIFHGNKDVATYNLQRDNIEMANSVLLDALSSIYTRRDSPEE